MSSLWGTRLTKFSIQSDREGDIACRWNLPLQRRSNRLCRRTLLVCPASCSSPSPLWHPPPLWPLAWCRDSLRWRRAAAGCADWPHRLFIDRLQYWLAGALPAFRGWLFHLCQSRPGRASRVDDRLALQPHLPADRSLAVARAGAGGRLLRAAILPFHLRHRRLGSLGYDLRRHHLRAYLLRHQALG